MKKVLNYLLKPEIIIAVLSMCFALFAIQTSNYFLNECEKLQKDINGQEIYISTLENKILKMTENNGIQ